MPKKLLTKDERLKYVARRELFIDIFCEKPEMRLESPAEWHKIVDQYELLNEALEQDQTAKCLLTVTRKLDNDGKLLIKKLDGKEHPKGKWEMDNAKALTR